MTTATPTLDLQAIADELNRKPNISRPVTWKVAPYYAGCDHLTDGLIHLFVVESRNNRTWNKNPQWNAYVTLPSNTTCSEDGSLTTSINVSKSKSLSVFVAEISRRLLTPEIVQIYLNCKARAERELNNEDRVDTVCRELVDLTLGELKGPTGTYSHDEPIKRATHVRVYHRDTYVNIGDFTPSHDGTTVKIELDVSLATAKKVARIVGDVMRSLKKKPDCDDCVPTGGLDPDIAAEVAEENAANHHSH